MSWSVNKKISKDQHAIDLANAVVELIVIDTSQNKLTFWRFCNDFAVGDETFWVSLLSASVGYLVTN